jgi:hypothetical protein
VHGEAGNDIRPNAARAAAAQVFIHCFPLMLADAIRRCHPMGFHQFHLLTEQSMPLAPGLDGYDPRVVVTSAWIDLANEPVVVRLPAMHGRYFTLTLIDTVGEPFASLGSRTGDDGGFDLALAGPTWRGELPGGLTARRAPSESVWAVSRVHAHSAVDRPETLAIAKRQCLALLRPELHWPRPTLPALEPPASPCVRQVAEMPAPVFFHRLDTVLERAPSAYAQTLRPAIAALRAQLAGPPDPEAWDSEFATALARGLTDGLAAIRAAAEASSGSEGLGWRAMGARVDRASPNALTRAARAYAGMGAPVRDDMLSLVCERDESGRLLSGADAYRIHFPPGALPPVQAFWWLSPEPAGDYGHRPSVGDRSDLVLGADGSLDLLIQAKPPQASQIANWLPSPAGPFSLVMRLYWAREEALRGAWRMPPVERLGSGAGRRARQSPARSRTFQPPPVDFASPLLAWRTTP